MHERGVIHVGRIVDADDAASALFAAGRGAAILALSTAGTECLPRFSEDLRRFGSVRVIDVRESAGKELSTLDDEQWRLLALLGAGHSVEDAARELSVSRRTAERRLAAARTSLGVRTTAEAVSLLRRQQALLGLSNPPTTDN
jgi:DNA-binding NarL/FixJ family response regulator